MIAAIELAMLARLKAVADTGALGFRWRTLGTYPEQWEDYLDSEGEIACPAAWVVFAGWDNPRIDYGPDGDDVLHVDGSFGLMVADRNMRPKEQYQRHGGIDVEREPGTYRLMMAAIASLANQTLGLDLVKAIVPGSMRPVAATAASNKQRMSRLACELRCSFPIAIVADGDLTMLETLHANWDVPLFGSPIAIDADPGRPGIQLPDDAHADATDIVTLGDQE
ncbi:phage protein Gp37 [Sphingomonas sp. CJ99]